MTDHVIGGSRFIFGFGSGFPSPLFADERGLSYADRHERLRESLDLILKCWTATEPFDWDGKHWRGKGIVATPRPLIAPHMPMATATDTPAMIELAGARGYTLLHRAARTGRIDPQEGRPLRACRQGRGPRHAAANVTAARYVYLADSRREAMDDLRDDINYELGYQMKRGLIRVMTSNYGLGSRATTSPSTSWPRPVSIISAIRTRWRKSCAQFYDAAGGFGTLLIVDRQEMGDAGKSVPFDAAVRRARGAEACRPRAGARS